MNGFDNITANNGMGVAITGMVIVFVALILITLFVTVLPHVLRVVGRYYPEGAHGHGIRRVTTDDEAEAELRVAVAVAVALRQQQLRQPRRGAR